MKKYKLIGIAIVMIGSVNLLSFLFRPHALAGQSAANVYFGIALILLLGIYIVRLAANKALADI